jgi:hypothetical protein
MAYQYKNNSSKIEGFSMDKEIALRSLLFTLVFYLIASPQTANIFIDFLPRSVDVLIIQSIVFALIFYLVSLYL